MPRIYRLSRTGLRLLYKIRHHKGHGIHSPFVFNLITKVIEEKAPYYLYEDIKLYLESHPNIKWRTNKYNLLSFRLVNYFGAKNILILGSGKGINTLYATAPASNIVCNCYETDPEKYKQASELYKNWERKLTLHTDKIPQLETKQDCIFINLKNYNQLPKDLPEYLKTVSHEKTFIVVKGIRTNSRCKVLWKSISDLDSRTAMLDLFNIGIVFFDKRLYRWDYQISF